MSQHKSQDCMFARQKPSNVHDYAASTRNATYVVLLVC